MKRLSLLLYCTIMRKFYDYSRFITAIMFNIFAIHATVDISEKFYTSLRKITYKMFFYIISYYINFILQSRRLENKVPQKRKEDTLITPYTDNNIVHIYLTHKLQWRNI